MNGGIRTFEIYLVEGKPYGHEIEKPYPASIRGYELSFDFAGKDAHLVIVTNDWGVGRTIALRFAAAIAFGTFKTISIDLKDINNGQKTATKTLAKTENERKAVLEEKQSEVEKLF